MFGLGLFPGRLRFPFFFFFLMHAFQLLGDKVHCLRTVQVLFTGPTPLYLEKILKMSLTVLFTHLKIILL